MNTSLVQTLIHDWLMRRTTASGVRRVGEMPFVLGSEVGLVRNENQDRIVVAKILCNSLPSLTLVILCDGMGGMDYGAECAAITAATFIISCINNCKMNLPERAIEATKDANKDVYLKFRGRGGSTLSALLFDDKKGIGVNVGDSRIYSFDNSSLTKLTIDDTIAGQLSEKLKAETFRRNELLQYIGIGEDLEPHLININNLASLILTSDGLHFIGSENIQSILYHSKDSALAVRRLAELSKWLGGHDNATIAIVNNLKDQQFNTRYNDIVQLWDPFGELQIAIPDQYIQPEAKMVQAPVKEQPVRIKKNRTKKSKNTKPNKPKESKDTLVKQDSLVERPELKIDFVNNTNENENN